MKTYLHITLRLLIVLTIAGTVVSCRTKKEIEYPISVNNGRHSGTNANENVTKGKWKTLTVELTRHDNKKLYDELRQWLGTPYKYAAATKGSGTDCSGMVMQVFQAVYNLTLERNSAKIFERNCREIGKHRLHEADLVFFNNGKSGRITHVGIYLKDGYFVHASSSRGVIVSNIDENYYSTHFQCAGRVIGIKK